ncbi:hypothetical protein [Vibrio sp. YIC-376]|uniref:hypothetical protein n=1 Tax=Vibrio sp. YIC-376 TaxID=3136162 RepID=UPI00402B0246
MLCIPVAIYTGFRYGWSGVVAVALGGILLPVGFGLAIGAFPPDLDIYILSVVTAGIAASKYSLKELAIEPKPSLGFFAGFALLPLFVLIAHEELNNGLHITVTLSLLPVLYFLLFLFGLSRKRFVLVAITLSSVTLLGIVLELIQDWSRVHYLLNTLADLFTGLGWYFAGSYVSGISDERSRSSLFQKWPRITLAALVTLWAAYPVWSLLRQSNSDWMYFVSQLTPVGSVYAMPLASLFAGLRFRFRGAAIVTLIAFASELAGPAMELYNADIGTPFTAFGFAVLGTHIADHLRGIDTKWYPWHWTAYVLFGLICVISVWGADGLESPEGLIYVLMFLVALIVIAMAGRKLLSRANVLLSSQSLKGVVSLVGVLLLLPGILSHIQLFWRSIIEAVSGVYLLVITHDQNFWDSGNEAMLTAILISYFTVLLAATSSMLKSLPPLIKDWRKLMAWFRATFGKGILVVTVPSREQDEPQDGDRSLPLWLVRTTDIVQWLRNGMALISAVLIVLIIIYAD